MLDNAPLNYPGAVNWMWNYCIYLGPYKYENTKYDLGVYINPYNELSAAVVYGNEEGNYISGRERYGTTMPCCIEAFRRAHLIGL